MHDRPSCTRRTDKAAGNVTTLRNKHVRQARLTASVPSAHVCMLINMGRRTRTHARSRAQGFAGDTCTRPIELVCCVTPALG